MSYLGMNRGDNMTAAKHHLALAETNMCISMEQALFVVRILILSYIVACIDIAQVVGLMLNYFCSITRKIYEVRAQTV